MDVPKDDDVNSQFTFTYDDIKGTVHVVDHQTGEEYDLLKEDTGWFDAEFKFDVWLETNLTQMLRIGCAESSISAKLNLIVNGRDVARYVSTNVYFLRFQTCERPSSPALSNEPRTLSSSVLAL